jgi:putative chitobiose transport system permease protein
MTRKKFSFTPYLFLTPALLVTAVFVLYPIISVLFYSFTDYDIVRPPVWIGLKNFQALLGDETFWKAMGNSLIYLIVTPTLIFLSIGAAIVVNRKLPAIGFFRSLYYIPAVSGSIAIGICWRWLFDYNGGLVNGFLVPLGILKEPVQWLAEPAYTLPIAMLLTIWAGIGYYMMVFLAGLQNIPEELYDAAQIDGCNSFQKHWNVSLPGLRPQIVFVAIISSLAALKVFDEIYILTGATGGILDSGVTIVFYLWRNAFRLSHAGYASAIAIGLLVVTLAFSVLNVRLLDRDPEVS